MSKNKTEMWKDIPGYAGEYQASTLGQIKSLKRKVRGRSRFGTEFKRTVPERILRPGAYCKTGHLSVVLRKGTNGKPVHQLVMKTFIGEPPPNQEVRHLNGNPKDNRLCNLEYGTRRENILDVFRIGRAWRKLTIDSVIIIRYLAENKVKKQVIADLFNIQYTYVFEVIRGTRCYKWL
jgi:hypothetical protein